MNSRKKLKAIAITAILAISVFAVVSTMTQVVRGSHSVTAVIIDSPTTGVPAYVRPRYNVSVQFGVTTDVAGG